MVAGRMNGGVMSAVNLSEVLKRSIEHGGSAEVPRYLMDRAEVKIVPFDEAQAAETAALYLTTRDKGLSFADRACLNLGIRLNVPIYTADNRLCEVRAPVKIVMIRPEKKTKVKS